MSTHLGFNPDNVLCVVEPNMKLLVQANTPLTVQDTWNTLNTLEIIEAFDIAREIVLDHITPYEITLDRGKPSMLGQGKKYRKDKQYKLFWQDVIMEIEEALNIHFTRKVELSTGTKNSIHPMSRRVMKLVILPVLQEFGNHNPSAILSILDAAEEGMNGKDIFGHLSRFIACGAVELHADNVAVARKLLQRKCNSHSQKYARLVTIRNVTESIQERV